MSTAVARNFADENWEARDRILNDLVYIDCDERGETVAAAWVPYLSGREQAEVEEEAIAIARVIAAAPKLLAACQAALDFLDDGGPENDLSPLEQSTRLALRDAIAKAEGSTGKTKHACPKCGSEKTLYEGQCSWACGTYQSLIDGSQSQGLEFELIESAHCRCRQELAAAKQEIKRLRAEAQPH